MSLYLLVNTVNKYAAQVVASDTSDTAVATQGAINSIRGGARHLRWTSDHATAARRVAYVNKLGNLTADFCVVVDAAAHEGENLKVISFTAYGATEATIDSRTLAAADFVGMDASDFVLQFASAANQQAFAVEFGGTTYQKTARQIYFGEALEFEFMPEGSAIQYAPASIHEPAVFHDGQPYWLHGTANFSVADVSRTLLDTYLELPRKEPVFFYDSSGTATLGQAIEQKLWHCVILGETISPVYDNMHRIDFNVGILRHW